MRFISSPRRSAGPFRHRRSGQGGDGQGYALKLFHVNILNLSQRQDKSWSEKIASYLGDTTISSLVTKFSPQGKLSWQMETQLFPVKDSICYLFTEMFPTVTDFFPQSDGHANLESTRDLMIRRTRNFVNSFNSQTTQSICPGITFRWSHDLVSGTFPVSPCLPRW